MRRRSTGLALLGLGIGGVEVAAPGAVARVVGADDGPGTRAVVRLACGARELAAAVGVGASRHVTGWLWARVVGDVLDLGLLATVLARRPRGRLRALGAGAVVLGVTAADVGAARRTRGRAADAAAVQARAAVTVACPPSAAYASWRDLAGLPTFMTHLRDVTVLDERRSRWTAAGPGRRPVRWDAELTDDKPGELIAWRSLPGSKVPNSGRVRFDPAPGGRGTEVSVELEYRPPAGRLGAAVAALAGEEPDQQLRDELRRYKQVAETGEVVRSEGAPAGTRAADQLLQRAARPRAEH